jgi:hypothetical protein
MVQDQYSVISSKWQRSIQRNNKEKEMKGSRGTNIIYPIIRAEFFPGVLELTENRKTSQKKNKGIAIKHISKQGRNKEVPAGHLVA